MIRSSRSAINYGDFTFGGGSQIRPTPLFSESVDTIRDAKGDPLFITHTLDFAGTVLANGSESGQLDFLLSEKESIQQALASGNQEFQIIFDGQAIVSGIFPRVNNVSFDEGTYVDRFTYNFQFSYDENFYGSGIQTFSETWGFEENEDRRSANVRHDITAVGLDTNPQGTNNTFDNAKTFVLSKTGYNNAVTGTPAFVQVSGISFDAYEELRSEQVDVQGGSYSVSETFTLSSGNFIHVRTEALQTDEEGVSTVTLDGGIRGLGRLDAAFFNALTAYNNTIKPRFTLDASGAYAQLGGEAQLFTSNAISQGLTKNQFLGTLDYSISYSDSESENLPSGILEFNLSVQDSSPIRSFASFAIPNRTLGNVTQDIGTSSEGTFGIQGNAQSKADFPFVDLLAFVEDKINEQRPQVSDYQTLRLSQHQLTQDEANNTVNFNFSWIYTLELNAVPSVGDINII